MPKITVEVTPVYDWLEASKAEINILRGGRGSSKSYSTAQLFVLNKLCTLENKTFVIARKTLPALRKTAMKDTMDLVRAYQIPHSFNKSELELKVGSNILYFLSVDDPEKIKSLNTDDVWLEEATEFNYDDFTQFNLRCSGQMYLTFNPTSSLHWIKRLLIESGNYDVGENVSTYKDNLKFIPERQIKAIKQLEHEDANLYAIYGKGEWGELENIIYSGWEVNPEIELDKETKKLFYIISRDKNNKVIEKQQVKEITYGIDWGFSSPAVLVKIYWFDGDKVIWEELIYEERLTTEDLLKRAKELIKPEHRGRETYCGTDEPGSIETFFQAGFNVHQAVTKVRDGINFCKSHLIGIIGESLIKEAQGYKRKEDKDGIVLEEPVKFMDHGMDAGRYGTYSAARHYQSADTLISSFR